MFLKPHTCYLVGDDQSLLEVGEGTSYLNLLPLLILREDVLEDLLCILFYQAVGCIDNILCGAVVLFQLEDLCLGEVGSEFQYVVNVGTPEGVDALRIVTHHADAVVLLCQLFHDQMLGEVGVLVLIHQDILELIAVSLQHIGMIAEQYVGLHQQVVEIHAVACAQPALIALIDLMNHWSLGHLVILHYLCIGSIHARCDEAVLCP